MNRRYLSAASEAETVADLAKILADTLVGATVAFFANSLWSKSSAFAILLFLLNATDNRSANCRAPSKHYNERYADTLCAGDGSKVV